MTTSDVHRTSPLIIKTTPELDVPSDEPVAYVLTRDGLFLHRRHAFFTSCVRARLGPAELHPQAETLRLHHPSIPQALFERLVGYFSLIGRRHGSEAAALLLWDETEEEIVAHVPTQRASVSESWSGRRTPLEVAYDVPVDLPARNRLIGDVHSHVNEAAYASAQDRRDERHRPGLHVVVGRIGLEPPDLHAEFVVDGCRFLVDPMAVIEGYETRREEEVPDEWLERVKVEVITSAWGGSAAHRAETSAYSSHRSGNGGRGGGDRWA